MKRQGLVLCVLAALGLGCDRSSVPKSSVPTQHALTTPPSPPPVPDAPVVAPVSTTVYVTRTGTKYHAAGCSYLRSSSSAITMDDAKKRGLSPCSRCNPYVEKRNAITPHVVSLIMCDRFLNNAEGTLFTFEKVVHAIRAIGFPAQLPSLTLAIELSQGRGDVDVQMRLRHRERAECVVYDKLWKFRFADPFDLLVQSERVSPVTFPGPGPYVLEALFDGVPLSSRRLMLGGLTVTGDSPRGAPA